MLSMEKRSPSIYPSQHQPTTSTASAKARSPATPPRLRALGFPHLLVGGGEGGREEDTTAAGGGDCGESGRGRNRGTRGDWWQGRGLSRRQRRRLTSREDERRW
jgi:hypothetical protein